MYMEDRPSFIIPVFHAYYNSLLDNQMLIHNDGIHYYSVCNLIGNSVLKANFFMKHENSN